MVSIVTGFVRLARTDAVGFYYLPHSRPGFSSIELSYTSRQGPDGVGLYRDIDFDIDPRADASLSLGCCE